MLELPTTIKKGNFPSQILHSVLLPPPPVCRGEQGFNQKLKVGPYFWQPEGDEKEEALGYSLLIGRNCLFPNSSTGTCSLGIIYC